METTVEWFVAITSFVMGASHVALASDWVEAFRAVHGQRRTGAFLNGGYYLFTGAFIAAGHPVWTGPAIAITVFGWLLVLKGAVNLLLPDQALRSIARGGLPGRFRIAGVALLAIGGWSSYCLWVRY